MNTNISYLPTAYVYIKIVNSELQRL